MGRRDGLTCDSAARRRGGAGRRAPRGRATSSASRTCSGRCAAPAAGASASSTSFTFRTVPAPEATAFDLRFAARHGRARAGVAGLGARRAGRDRRQPGDHAPARTRPSRRWSRSSGRCSAGAAETEARAEPASIPSTAELHPRLAPRGQAPPGRRGRAGRRRAPVLPIALLPRRAARRGDRRAPAALRGRTGGRARCASSTSRRGAAPTTACRSTPPRSPHRDARFLLKLAAWSSSRVWRRRTGWTARGRSCARGAPAASTRTSRSRGCRTRRPPTGARTGALLASSGATALVRMLAGGGRRA